MLGRQLCSLGFLVSSLKNDDFLLKNDEFLLRNDEFLLRNDEFLLINDEFLLINDDLHVKQQRTNAKLPGKVISVF